MLDVAARAELRRAAREKPAAAAETSRNTSKRNKRRWSAAAESRVLFEWDLWRTATGTWRVLAGPIRRSESCTVHTNGTESQGVATAGLLDAARRTVDRWEGGR